MSKKRISLTVEEEIVDKVDREAEKTSLNRSQKVEKILKRHFKNKGLDTAVILCGDSENKTLNLYQGKPVLHYILTQLAEKGITRAILLVGNNKAEIKKQFGTNFEEVALEYVEEERPLGTAAALNKIQHEVSEPFVALNGHVISNVDFQEMLEVHKEENNTATMALTTVEEPSKYGVVKMKGRQIKGFEEKPQKGKEPSQLINAGTYIFEPQIFQKAKNYQDLENVFKELTSQEELSGYIYGGKWVDIEMH